MSTGTHITDADIERLFQARSRSVDPLLLAEILTAIDVLPQRHRRHVEWWPPRRSLLLVAGIAVLLGLGGMVVGSGILTPRPTPSPSPQASISPSPAEPVDYGELGTGFTLDARSFSEPFRAIMPAFDPPGAARQIPASGGTALRIAMGCCWVTWLLDDVPIPSDPCIANPELIEIPATPREVGDWLASARDLHVSEPVAILMRDGIALRYDVEPRRSNRCSLGMIIASGTPEATSVALGPRLYAIPTGDDTLLYVVWADQGSLPSVQQGADDLVRSMIFY